MICKVLTTWFSIALHPHAVTYPAQSGCNTLWSWAFHCRPHASHGKCLFTWQNCGESRFRWGMDAKQKSESYLPVLCKGNLFCAKVIFLRHSLKSRHNCDLSLFYTSRTISVKMTQPHQEQPLYTIDKMAVDFQVGEVWHGCYRGAFLNLKSKTLLILDFYFYFF